MNHHRIIDHPVLPIPERAQIGFTWRGRPIAALEGETIASALQANGVRVLGHHARDGAPQGLFCADGRCALCLVIVDGAPVKACQIRVRPGLAVEPSDGLPVLPSTSSRFETHPPRQIDVDALVIGGGPAGLAAASELGSAGVRTLLIDDKPRLGGKLLLQTHRFFGSVNAVHAGTRGFAIARRLEEEARSRPSIEIWTSASALAVWSDRKVGVLRSDEAGGGEYVLVSPRALLVMTGARERFLTFRGNTLPGVLGAGAFQTLVNRDLVRPARRVLVVGGGNVGLIAAFHAIQAGIEVVALVEASKACGGYHVHRDKLARQGVPILTSHTILAANGVEEVESATIARVDEQLRPVPGTERSFACEAVLVAVGLDPERELFDKARAFGLTAFVAGDADEVAEASSAIMGGRIRGREAARALGVDVELPAAWPRLKAQLASRPGPTIERPPEPETGVRPIFHCTQEIPCDPCAHACPEKAIAIDADDIRHIPLYVAEEIGRDCIGCERCVTICPGQAITLVDYRADPSHPLVTVPFELDRRELRVGAPVAVVDINGETLGEAVVVAIHAAKVHDRTVPVKVRAPRAIAQQIAGIRTGIEASSSRADAEIAPWVDHLEDDAIVCRCERVRASSLRELIASGIQDPNELKVMSRAGLGACGARACGPLVVRLLAEAGVAREQILLPTPRPLTIEVPLGVFAGAGAPGREPDHG